MNKSQGQLILQFLADRKWHHVRAIMEYVVPGGVNVAIRSRISDLNKKLKPMGMFINSRRVAGSNEHEYRLEECYPVKEESK